MKYSYNVSQEAEWDILESYLWYEEKREGLGEEFLASLDKAKKAIISNPGTYRIRRKNARGFLVDRFPYIILYALEEENINVISVFHTSKDPTSWEDRIE